MTLRAPLSIRHRFVGFRVNMHWNPNFPEARALGRWMSPPAILSEATFLILSAANLVD
jgi:hypothetical protein